MAKQIGTEKVTRKTGYLYYIGKDGRVWQSPFKWHTRGMKKAVSKERIKRQLGYLYFLNKAGYVAQVKMQRR